MHVHIGSVHIARINFRDILTFLLKTIKKELSITIYLHKSTTSYIPDAT